MSTQTESDSLVEEPVAKKTEEQKVIAWREEKLLEAGYPEIYAKRIAKRYQGIEYIDLHRAVDMIKAGAEPHIAADILL